METNRYRVPEHGGVVDYATLYLCRQGHTWVVVMESPHVRGALRLRHGTDDPYDARFELLSTARRACPEANILSLDGALEGADYEWRLDVRGVMTHTGDLGAALHRELADNEPRRHGRRRDERRVSHRCHWGRCSQVSGRPLAF
jgi:hypothetical protein